MDAFIRVVASGSVVFIGANDPDASAMPLILSNTLMRLRVWEKGYSGAQLTAQIARECVGVYGEAAIVCSTIGSRPAWVIAVNADERTIRFRSSEFDYNFEDFVALDLAFMLRPGYDWSDGIMDVLAIVHDSNHPYYRERLRRIKRMLEDGLSISAIAEALGVSQDVVRKEIKDHMNRGKR